MKKSGSIKWFGLEQAPAAYAKMMSGKARFRIVLTMDVDN
jgi:D-arabinose 1-dehydrogenase-like Zn-dependent alcohol dehydrogenase